MILLISFLIGLQILDVLATSPPIQFVHPPCNSLEVKNAADAAINEFNAHRTEGYFFSLQRIVDAQQDQNWGRNTFFFLVLDMLETKCHVLSREPWKECKIRQPYETVYGQCKMLIQSNRNSNDWNLLSYDCSFQLVSRSVIVNICPDCPIPGDPSEDIFQKTALETLAKFNAENEDNNYFAILNVTKADFQWVVGPSNSVEYIIQETSCPKNPPVSDITQCPFLPTETAARGHCSGSVVDSQIENKKYVDVKCKLFLRPPPATDEQAPQSMSEPQEPQHPQPSPNIAEAPPKQKETVGRVVYHYPWSKHAVVEGQEPSPTSGSTPASPGQGAGPQLIKPPRPAIPPFPRRGFSQSDQCPGDILVHVHGLQLPSRPQAETS